MESEKTLEQIKTRLAEYLSQNEKTIRSVDENIQKLNEQLNRLQEMRIQATAQAALLADFNKFINS